MKTILFVFLSIVIGFCEAKNVKCSRSLVPQQHRLFSDYSQCKLACKQKRDAELLHETKQQYVERLRQELAEAQQVLVEAEKFHIPEVTPAPEIRAPNPPPSRFDHLKMAASKIAESGHELKHVVTGDSNPNEIK